MSASAPSPPNNLPAQPPATGDARALAHQHAAYRQLPSSLRKALFQHTGGSLHQRAAQVLHWRKALLKGSLPSLLANQPWPTPQIATPIFQQIEGLGLVPFCQQSTDLTDVVLAEMLPLLANAGQGYQNALENAFQQLQQAALKALQAKQKAKEEEAAQQAKKAETTTSQAAGSAKRSTRAKPVTLHPQLLEKLHTQAQRQAQAWLTTWKDATFEQTWGERVVMWRQIADVFGQLQHFLGAGWDLSQGILQHTGWLEAARLRDLLKTLPQLQALLKALGRLRHTKQQSTKSLQRVIHTLKRPVEIAPPHSPQVPTETRGTVYDNDLSRMLPAEAVLLKHPVLRQLWLARYAERGLLSYLVEGTSAVKSVEEEHKQQRLQPKAQQERGPLMIVIDTSASMQGMPEQVAKAIALEGACVAYQEQRPCLLYAFSGPEDVMELNISLQKQSFENLLAFLGASFHGGTDVSTPVAMVLKRLQEERWRNADALIVSDGEFGVSSQLASEVRAVCKQGQNRFHGLLVGGHDPRAMEMLCHQVTHFSSWQATLTED